MKRFILTLTTMLTMSLSAQAITYTQARNEALFLTDKMAYELGLTERQYDAVYEINLDYLMSVNSRSDLYSTCWYRRNLDLSYVLTAIQYNTYCTLEYFYRPVYWSSGFNYRIYTRYTNRKKFYYNRPAVYTTYRGGHSWANNGGKSWYKGKAYGGGTKMTARPTGTKSHSSHSVTVNNVNINNNVTINRNYNSKAPQSGHSIKKTSTTATKPTTTATQRKTTGNTGAKRNVGTARQQQKSAAGNSGDNAKSGTFAGRR